MGVNESKSRQTISEPNPEQIINVMKKQIINVLLTKKLHNVKQKKIN